jgi:hypothetical protein
VAVSFEEFARELRAFDDRRVVVREMGKEMRGLLPPLRTAIRAHALEILPKEGGLNEWVAAARITVSVKTSGRRVGVIVKGSRRSVKNKSDLDRIDRGRVRAPSWGRRWRGQWHTQAVPPGWFTEPVTDETRLHDAAERALDRAFDEIRRG